MSTRRYCIVYFQAFSSIQVNSRRLKCNSRCLISMISYCIFFRDLSQIRTNCQKKIESRLKVDQIFSKYKLLSVSTLQLLQNSRKYHNNLELAVGASTRHLNLYFKYLSSYLNSQTCKLNREQSIKRAFYWLIYSIHSVRCKAIRRILMNSVNSANSTIFSKYSKLISSV